MSDESEAAWRKHMRPGVLYGENQRQGFRAGYDAGRASRDAEVEEVKAESKSVWDNLYERENELSEMTTRAEAAEAVIETALRITDDMRSDGWHIGKTVKDCGEAIYVALTAAPQSVLAERDRNTWNAALDAAKAAVEDGELTAGTICAEWTTELIDGLRKDESNGNN